MSLEEFLAKEPIETFAQLIARFDSVTVVDLIVTEQIFGANLTNHSVLLGVHHRLPQEYRGGFDTLDYLRDVYREHIRFVQTAGPCSFNTRRLIIANNPG